MSFIDRRAHERVVYPAGQRPTLTVGGGKYEIIDCSERGLRVARAGAALLEASVDVQGRVRFPPGNEVMIEGVVLRVQSDAIAIQFTGLWIPRDVILGELRRMKQGLSK
jgi:PilZ domain-containing protein